jgi:DNA repair protein RecN (Recombination protein N)
MTGLPDMLRTLEIRDILIIDRLVLAFQPGLNVLTGETGAGKSILLDAVWEWCWAGGAAPIWCVRAPRRARSRRSSTCPRPPCPCRCWPRRASRLDPGEDLILRRDEYADGRKTAWINDRRCQRRGAARAVGTLVELHGQHDDRGLLNPRATGRCWTPLAGWT